MWKGRFEVQRERGFLQRLGLVGSSVRAILQTTYKPFAVRAGVRTGRNFRFGLGTVISSAHGLIIGDDVAVGRHCTIEVSGFIGDHTLIAANVGIIGRDDHALNEVGVPCLRSTWIGDRPETSRDSVRIGVDVWIGYGAIVLSGVEIGDAAVVAAGAVVSRDVPTFAVVAGNPARVVGTRFESQEEGARHLAQLRLAAGKQ
jgi:acetyltransferase-like isoleucine patch superfamily enzyme